MLSTFPLFLFLYSSLHLRHLPSFPTRRSSDLASASPRSGPAARTDPRSAPSATCRCSWNAGSSIFPARPSGPARVAARAGGALLEAHRDDLVGARTPGGGHVNDLALGLAHHSARNGRAHRDAPGADIRLIFADHLIHHARAVRLVLQLHLHTEHHLAGVG